jgi:hypothetical protein
MNLNAPQIESGPQPLTARKSSAGRVLLPYQQRWINDEADLKAWEKSRRIGADYTEAYDVASSRITVRRNEDYWYSSADESAAYEFAEYVRFWSKVFGAVADGQERHGVLRAISLGQAHDGDVQQSAPVPVQGRRCGPERAGVPR